MHPAEAGGVYRYISAGCCHIEALLDDGSFTVLAQSRQAFVKAMEAPDVVGVLAGAGKGVVKAEIGAVNGFSFLDMVLFQ